MEQVVGTVKINDSELKYLEVPDLHKYFGDHHHQKRHATRRCYHFRDEAVYKFSDFAQDAYRVLELSFPRLIHCKRP